MNYRKRLPSLTALVALEATIRLRSVSAAAKELGVTPAAVSRHIALLEEDFEHPLFGRGQRTLEPTPACRVFGAALAESFTALTEAVDTMRAGTSGVVAIGASVAFSSLWLLPRLVELRREHPRVKVRVVSQDTRFVLDIGEVDMAFRFGVPPFGDGRVLANRKDVAFPVCSPAYAAEREREAFPRGRWDFLETDVPHRNWYRWADWFDRAGLKVERVAPTLRFSYLTETIAAARTGQGVALGWETLIEHHLADGSLVRLGPHAVVPEGSHNLVVPVGPFRSSAHELVADWLSRGLRGSASRDCGSPSDIGSP